MTMKEQQEQLVEILRRWQKVESVTVAQTAQIMNQTENPVVRLVMEIIQRDSAMHRNVQQFIIETITTKAVELTPDELVQVWGAIEEHIAAERQTADLVADARKALAGSKNVVQDYLLKYLETDEQKHDQLLDDLALIKRGMYQSA